MKYGKQNNVLMVANATERRRRIEHFIMKGFTDQIKLAKKFGVSQSTIHTDIKKIAQRWKDEAHKDSKNIRTLREKELRGLIDENRKEHKISKQRILKCKKCKGVGYLDDNLFKPCPKCDGEGDIIKYDGPANPAFLKEARTCLIEMTKLEGLSNNIKVDHNHSGTVGHVTVNADNLLANADPKDVIATKLLLERLGKNNKPVEEDESKDEIIDVVPIEPEETEDE